MAMITINPTASTQQDQRILSKFFNTDPRNVFNAGAQYSVELESTKETIYFQLTHDILKANRIYVLGPYAEDVAGISGHHAIIGTLRKSNFSFIPRTNTTDTVKVRQPKTFFAGENSIFAPPHRQVAIAHPHLDHDGSAPSTSTASPGMRPGSPASSSQ